MEPTDIDKLIKAKMQESGGMHQKEMDAAKPFIWSAVQKNVNRTPALRWYHLAAAVMFLLISFAFVLQNVQKSHENEMVLLSQKIDQLEQNFVSQESVLKSKDDKLGILASELKSVEMKLIDLQEQKPLVTNERIVYRTDTVVVKQIEYVTRASNPVIAMEVSENTEMRDESIDLNNDSNNINYAIYPSVARQSKNQKSGTIRVKFLKASRN